MQSFTTPPITVFGQAAQPCALDRSSYSRRRERKSTAEAGFFISIQFYFEQKRDRRDVSLIPFLPGFPERSNGAATARPVWSNALPIFLPSITARRCVRSRQAKPTACSV